MYNSLAAICVATKLGCSAENIKDALLEVRVPGRSELVNNSKDLTIMIDYAAFSRKLGKYTKCRKIIY